MRNRNCQTPSLGCRYGNCGGVHIPGRRDQRRANRA